MSVAQIIEEAHSFSLPELEALEQLRLQRLQRVGKIASSEEGRLLERINAPMPHNERFAELRHKLQDEALSEDERRELVQIAEAREEANTARVEAVMQLAARQGRPFAQVWQQMVGDYKSAAVADAG
jgi:hypothetical protein